MTMIGGYGEEEGGGYGEEEGGVPHRRSLLEGSNGEGIIVAIADTGIDLSHCAFFDSESDLLPTQSQDVTPSAHSKVASLVTADPAVTDYRGSDGAHGTAVAGVAVGYDCGMTVGEAPGARVAFYDFSPYGTDDTIVLPTADREDFRTFYEYVEEVFTVGGASVLSGSWGANAGGVYTTTDREIDRLAFDHPRRVFVFAAGNDGRSSSGYRPSSPASAKNVIAVGAVFAGAEHYATSWPGTNASTTMVADFSSRGPLRSGRQCPTVYAQGVQQRVPYGYYHPVADHSHYARASGTSFSAPNITGRIARYQHHYKLRHEGALPLSALVHAMLLASSVPVESRVVVKATGPGAALSRFDNATAYGVPKVAFTGQEVELVMTTASSVAAYCYVTTAPIASLPVAMTFTDLPHAPYSSTLLVNDVDMDVYVDHSLVASLADRHATHERVTLGPLASESTVRVVVKERDGVVMDMVYVGAYLASPSLTAVYNGACGSCGPGDTVECGDGGLRYCDVSSGLMTVCVARVNPALVGVATNCRGNQYDGVDVGTDGCLPALCDGGFYFDGSQCRCFEGVYHGNSVCRDGALVENRRAAEEVAEVSGGGERDSTVRWLALVVALAVVL
jgi:hypothetical protein